jgi:hypothetical protein
LTLLADATSNYWESLTMNDAWRKVTDILEELDLDKNQIAVTGSGVMALYGIDREIGDLDIMSTTRYWFELFKDPTWKVFTTDPSDAKRRCDPPYLYRVVNGTEVNVFHDWRIRDRGNIDFNEIFRNRRVKVRGWPCIDLEFLFSWKAEVARPKDIKDLTLIGEILND